MSGAVLGMDARALAAALAVNLALYACHWLVSDIRSVLHWEYFAAALLVSRSHRGWRVAGWLLAVLALLAEAARLVSSTFGIAPESLLEALGYMDRWPWEVLPFYLAGVAVLVGLVWLAARLTPARTLAAPVWIGLAGATLAGDIAAGSNMLSPTVLGRNTVTSDFFLASGASSWVYSQAHRIVTAPPRAGRVLDATPVRDAVRGFEGRGDVLVVVAESLGLHADPAGQAAFEDQIREALGVPVPVRFGRDRFSGATIDAEMRVLCGRGRGNVDLAIRDGDCLPRDLAAKGWTTLAAHGNWSAIYGRQSRYPALGFAHTRFRTRDSGGSLCRRWITGVCDSALLDWLAEDAPGPAPRLMYLMTLETHVPLTACRPQDRTGSEIHDGCHLLFFRMLGEHVRAARRPLRVIVVGDHAPPFPIRADRQAFSPREVTFMTFDMPVSAAR